MHTEIVLAGDVAIRRGAASTVERADRADRAERTGHAERVRLRGLQQRVAFAMLVLERDRGVGREALADALWPDGPPATWPTALRNIVSRVRSFVATVVPAVDDPVSMQAGRYRLHLPDDVVVDVEQAAERVAAAQEALRSGDPAQARQLAGAAIGCLQESFLPGHEGAWVAGRRAHLAELWITGLEVLSRAANVLGDGLAALVAAKEAVARAPLRESAHRCLIAAHAAAGNRAEALRAYQRLRKALAEELGVDPAPETEAAYLDLLGVQPGLGEDRHEPDRVATAVPAAPAVPVDPAVRVDPVVPVVPVEHSTALDELMGAWAEAVAGRARLVVVTGPAGVGKSRLVAAAARRVSNSAGLVLFGGCHRPVDAAAAAAAPHRCPAVGRQAPYQPLVEALDGFLAARIEEVPLSQPRARAELRRTFPSLGSGPSAGRPSDEAVLGDALADVVLAAAADRPVMIVLDDLQWAGEALFRVLQHVGRRAADARLLMVAVSRDGLPPEHPFPRAIEALGDTACVRHLQLGGPEQRPAAMLEGARARPVTYLFAAVEQDNARYPGSSVMAVLREAIEARRGHVFLPGELEVGALFDRAADAIAAATSAQRALASLPAGDGEARGATVRMAIHTGEPDATGRPLGGAVVERVTRLRDTGHAGQVLVSAATRELVGDSLPEGVDLVEIGTWLFNGGNRPQRVYQLCHPDLESGFPPLPVGRRAPGRLPSYLTTFVGREADCDQTLALLQSHRVVTLTGEGGIGKTRLAVETAQRASVAEYPDGVRFCDVSSVPDGASLVEHLAGAMGVAVSTGGDPRRDLLAAVEGSQLLLVVDNCEVLRDAAADLVGAIVAAAPDLRVLATSRLPLRVAGERIRHVHPLGWSTRARPAGGDAAAGSADNARPGDSDPAAVSALGRPASSNAATGSADAATDGTTRPAPSARLAGPAVQLLIDRARAAGASVDDGDPALAQITSHLDDIPLAIELVAPRLATVPPAVLAARLARRFDVLDTGNGHPARQRTLRTTIDWSYRLLGPEPQRLFDGLSVFSGGWTLETAETVVASALDLDRDELPSLMAELVEHSMIRMEPSGRGTAHYVMLSTLQAFAADQLARSGRHDVVAGRHAAYFVELVEQSLPHRRGPLEAAWIDQLAAEFDNLREAYRWLVQADRVHDALRLVAALGYDAIMREWFEVGRWASELAARPDVADDPLHAVALAVASNVAIIENRFEDAARLSAASLEAERRCDAPPCWISRNTLAWLTTVGMVEGDWHAHLDAMADIGTATGEPLAVAVSDFVRARIRVFAGDAERARGRAERLATLGKDLANPTILAMGLLAHGLSVAGAEPDVAAAHYDQAFQVASSAHNPLIAQQALRATEELNARTVDPAAALIRLRTIARRFHSWGNLNEQVNTILGMLDSIVAAGGLIPAATICGALARSPWGSTAPYRLADRALAERLSAREYASARRVGALMPPAELVAYVSRVVDEILGDESAA